MISKGERRWVIAFAVVIIVITTIPYVIGFALQDDSSRFTGFIFGLEDGNSYIAKMLSGSTGEWLFRTPYTSFPQKGVLAFLPYILLGKLAVKPGLHDQLVALFQLFRWAAILLYAFAAYDFTCIFLEQVRQRRAATILIFLGGGLGFLSIFGIKGSGWYGGLPLEFYSPESFGFLAVFSLPHLTAGRAFLLWALASILRNHPEHSFWNKSLFAGGMLTLLGLMQPLTVVVAWAILAAGLAAQWMIFYIGRKKNSLSDGADLRAKTKLALVIGVISSPIPIYTFLSFQFDPYLSNWTKQNLILSPPPDDYLLAYGLMLPFVVAGAYYAIRRGNLNGIFLAGWLALFPFLSYAPFPLQRRLPEAIWICIVLLAMLPAAIGDKSALWKRLQQLMYLGVLSTVLFYAGALRTVQTVQSPLYISKGAVDAFTYLGQTTTGPFPVVLARYDLSNAAPAWVPVRTVIGHGPESVDIKILQPQVEAFLDGTLSLTKAAELAKSQQAAFLLAGPDDSLILESLYTFLTVQFSNNQYSIYKINSIP